VRNRKTEAENRAKAVFKRQESRRGKVAAENDAEGSALLEKTARLKSLRLAKETTERVAADTQSADRAIPIEKLNASNDE
jgi:hypothetical protein